MINTVIIADGDWIGTIYVFDVTNKITWIGPDIVNVYNILRINHGSSYLRSQIISAYNDYLYITSWLKDS